MNKRLFIYRLTRLDKIEFVDKLDVPHYGYDIASYITDHYLNDSPEGETYFAVWSHNGNIISVWKVFARKSLVKQSNS